MTAAAPPAAAPALLTDGQLLEIAVDELRPHPHNIRKGLGDPADFAQLVDSVRARGVRVPLIILPDRTAVAGHRRMAAAKEAGRATVPAIVKDLDEAAQIVEMLDENVTRSDLTALEEASAYQLLLALGHDEEWIARAAGMRPERVHQRIVLAQMPKAVVERVQDGSLPIKDAMQLARLLPYPKELERLIKDRSHYGGLRECKWMVDAKLQDLRRRAKREQARSIARSQGLQVIAQPLARSEENDPIPLGKLPGMLDVDVKAHRRLDCHAVFITHEGVTKAACRAPKASHPKECPKLAHNLATSSYAADERRRQEARQRRVDAAAPRTAVMRQIVEASALDHEVLDRAVLRFLLAKTPGDQRLLELLDGLPPLHRQQPHERTGEVAANLRAWILDGAIIRESDGLVDLELIMGSIRRAFVATMLLDDDHHLVDGDPQHVADFYRPAVARHLRLLASWGYALTPQEAKLVRKDDAERERQARRRTPARERGEVVA